MRSNRRRRSSVHTVNTRLVAFFALLVLICAGGAIAMVPIIAVFIAFQKFFINGMAGAVKG